MRREGSEDEEKGGSEDGWREGFLVASTRQQDDEAA
jgi:hypothetical protein